MKKFSIHYLTILLACSIAHNSWSFVLENSYHIKNATNSHMEINYNYCLINKENGKETMTCEDRYAVIPPRKTLDFIIDNREQYYQDQNNFYRHEIYIYQSVTPDSFGVYLRDEEDGRRWADYTLSTTTYGLVIDCSVTSESYIVLDDFGTNKIFCSRFRYDW